MNGSGFTGIPWLSSSAYAYPVLEVLHIAGIALLVGNLVLLELRLWGLGPELPLRPLARLSLALAVTGFGMLALSGLLMFAAHPAELLANRVFVVKLGLVMLAGAECGAVPRPWWPRAGRPRGTRPDRVVTGALARRHHLRPLDCLRLKEPPMQRRQFTATAALLIVPPAFAHHGWSSFDQNRPAVAGRQGRQGQLAQPACRDRARDRGRSQAAGRPGGRGCCRRRARRSRVRRC